MDTEQGDVIAVSPVLWYKFMPVRMKEVIYYVQAESGK